MPVWRQLTEGVTHYTVKPTDEAEQVTTAALPAVSATLTMLNLILTQTRNARKALARRALAEGLSVERVKEDSNVSWAVLEAWLYDGEHEYAPSDAIATVARYAEEARNEASRQASRANANREAHDDNSAEWRQLMDTIHEAEDNYYQAHGVRYRRGEDDDLDKLHTLADGWFY